MTVDEYNSASALKRTAYRVFRNPFVLFLIIPPILFLILNRFPTLKARASTKWSIIFTDIMIALIIVAAHYTVGVRSYVAVQLPVLLLSSTIGVWIFFINHQFEGVYWAHDDKWDRFQAAVKGSSFVNFPSILRWFTANIGFHYIHHLNYRIPNYNLDRCYREIPELHEVQPLKFLRVLRSLNLALWDDNSQRLIGFEELGKQLTS
jgi:omega-6 fatty acid desaturase (delta-12 desaturase)